MDIVSRAMLNLSRRARAKRGEVFLQSFTLGPHTKVLDLGCGDGSNIDGILKGTLVSPQNVYVADLGSHVEKAAERSGFKAVLIPESGRLPFPDKYFDVVFCSSVIEHVTIPKAEEWRLQSGTEFKKQAKARQAEFASEIQRLAKQYFVQTPNKWFPIESHTWLPFVGWLPRRFLIPVLRLTNRIWVKKTAPDWNLLTKENMRQLFPDSEIQVEKVFGLTKSIMAIKRESSSPS